MNEKIKKWLKISGIVIGALLLYGIFNLFFGGVSRRATYDFRGKTSRLLQKVDSVKSPALNVSNNGSGSRTSVPAVRKLGIRNLAKSEETPSGGEESQDKRVIKNGHLSLKVTKTENTAKEISEIAKSKGGEVFSSRFYEGARGSKNGTMTVKVPVNRFEETIEEIKKTATQVISESTTGKDVTEQYVDLQAQLKNKQAEEQTFVKMLDRAGKIEDALKVIREISQVKGEIERLEGRIKYLKSQTDMSMITINLSEDVEITPVSEGWRPWQVVKNSVKTLIKNAQGFINDLIYFIIVKIPSIIIFFLILWIVYWIGKKVYRKMRA